MTFVPADRARAERAARKQEQARVTAERVAADRAEQLLGGRPKRDAAWTAEIAKLLFAAKAQHRRPLTLTEIVEIVDRTDRTLRARQDSRP